MTKWLPLLLTVAGTIGATVLTPSFVLTHPTVFAVLNAAAMVLHAVLPSVFGTPSTSTTGVTK